MLYIDYRVIELHELHTGVWIFATQRFDRVREMYFLTHQIYDRAVGLCEYTFVGAVVVFAEVKYTINLS